MKILVTIGTARVAACLLAIAVPLAAPACASVDLTGDTVKADYILSSIGSDQNNGSYIAPASYILFGRLRVDINADTIKVTDVGAPMQLLNGSADKDENGIEFQVLTGSPNFTGITETLDHVQFDADALPSTFTADSVFVNLNSALFQTGGSVTVTLLSQPAISPSSPVPEPASWAMFISGLGLIGGTLRHKKGSRTLSKQTAGSVKATRSRPPGLLAASNEPF